LCKECHNVGIKLFRKFYPVPPKSMISKWSVGSFRGGGCFILLRIDLRFVRGGGPRLSIFFNKRNAARACSGLIGSRFRVARSGVGDHGVGEWAGLSLKGGGI
jgi:hypothetical protein